MSKPNSTRLRALLNYDPDTGVFTRRIGVRGFAAGSIVGSLNSNGYIYAKVDGYRCYVHRLAWCYVYGDWPSSELDHINNNPTDNRISNLRLSNPSANNLNKHRPRSDNKSGYRGVVAQNNKWRADIKLHGKHKYLGVFDTAEAAYAAYLNAKKLITLEERKP